MPFNQTQFDFAEDGLAIYRQFLDADELIDLKQRLQLFIENVVPSLPAHHVFCEKRNDLATLKQIQQIGFYEPWFDSLISAGKFPKLAEILLQSPVVPRNIQYFSKPPETGMPTPAHQDGFYFMLEPADAVTMWLALDPVDEENGCVRYIPQSHRSGMRPHGRTSTLGFSQGISDYPSDDDQRLEVAIAAEPGDLLVHHALTIHRADGNRSKDRQRRALGLIYYSANARENKLAHQAYQQQLAESLRVEGKI